MAKAKTPTPRKKVTKKAPEKKSLRIPPWLHRGAQEGASFFLLAVAIYLMAALVSFSSLDPGWSHTGSDVVRNVGGRFGAWFADLSFSLCGYVAYLIPFCVLYAGWLLFTEASAEQKQGFAFVRVAGFTCMLLSASGLAAAHWDVSAAALPMGTGGGGIMGDMLVNSLIDTIELLGASLVLLTIFLWGFTLMTGLSWFSMMEFVGAKTIEISDRVVDAGWKWYDDAHDRRRIEVKKANNRKKFKPQVKVNSATPNEAPRAPILNPSAMNESPVEAPSLGAALSSLSSKARDAAVEAVAEVKAVAPKAIAATKSIETSKPVKLKPRKQKKAVKGNPMPSLDLLDEAQAQVGSFSEDELHAMSKLLETKFRDFNVDVDVVAVHPGPVVTRFELQTAPGVKSSQINNLSKDIARSLSVLSVRVVEVIPGKTTVGIEVPNNNREMVLLSEIIGSEDFEDSPSPLTIALGKDIAGRPVVANIAKMPHLLVAGTTGSGKSVGVNAMLISLLFKSKPEDLRLILIDPKMLELNVYEGIPHLLAPVVTDMKEASNALRWSVAEMERRYRLMAAMGVRNIVGFNKKVTDAIKAGEPLKDPLWTSDMANDLEPHAPDLETLPFIVVVVDEFADMMMVVGKKVEELIARIAQKARAAGIHLILATQRPSVDVITGLIKANIPTRMAFQVSSKIDSRTIIDQQGAEQLLGHGDMLYLPPGLAAPERVHGAFVDDHEVHAVVEHLKSHGEANYNEDVLNETGALPGIPSDKPEGEGSEQDALYDQAVAIVTESRKASISYVQRRLKIGYNRSARMIEEMEAAGVVSSVGSNGQREVLAPPPVAS